MNQKERYNRYMSGKSVDRLPFSESMTWGQTSDLWHNDGLPEHVDVINMHLGCPYYNIGGISMVDGIDLLPPYPRKKEIIIEEDNRYVTFIDEFGRKRKALKEGAAHGTRMSMDHYMDWPMKTYEDFLEYKKGYSFDTIINRYPSDFREKVKKINQSGLPVSLLNPLGGTFGFYSMLRNFLGTEELSYAFYDRQKLIEECTEMLLNYFMESLKRAVKYIDADTFTLHEDMCFNNGPLMSPEMFKKFFLKPYKIFISYLKSNGVKFIQLDTDGNFKKLLPLYLDAGVDIMIPCECAAGIDVVKLRHEYPSLGIIGGIDKREIAKRKSNIDKELKYKIGAIIDKGRYMPSIDHSIPPDISLKNFEYYLELKRKYLNG